MKRLAAYVATLVSLAGAPVIHAGDEIQVDAGSDIPSWTFRWRPRGDMVPWLKQHRRRLQTGDACRLLASWKDDDVEYGSALHNIAEIILEPRDGEATYLVHEAAPGLAIRLGVRYHLEETRQLTLSVAMAAGDPSEDAFASLNRVEADTIRGKRWTFVTIRKPIRRGPRLYTFHFTCENGRTFLNFLRE
jgi:hypothetical protein